MQKRRTFLRQLGYGGVGVASLWYLPGCATAKTSLANTGLVSPESQGVSSQGLIDFFAAVEESDLEFHSIMINRNGKTILESWWHPFQKENIHTLYSLSKSFTSSAIGLLQDDGKLSVEDKVISFFPDQLPEKVSQNLAAMRVHDLLTMHTGHVQGTMGRMASSGSKDWVKAWLALEVPKQPGTHFMYNTGATYMLSAIVQVLSGQKVLDFLKPRLLEPLGIVGADWEEDPLGINVGGYGLRVRTQDILNFGQLYLQKGLWKGKQLISSNWIEEATKKQVNSQDNDSDWGQGYGYQFWRCKPGCYRGDGAFGQYCIVVPEKNAVIAITSESKDMGASMQLVWEHILPAMQDQKSLEVPKEQLVTLNKISRNRVLPIAGKSVLENRQQEVNGKTYTLAENEFKAEQISFEFKGDECHATFVEDGKMIIVKSGRDRWLTADNRKAANTLFALQGRTPMPTKISSHFQWTDKHTMVMKLKYTENLHHDLFTFSFSENGLTMSFGMSLSFRAEPSDPRSNIEGRLS